MPSVLLSLLAVTGGASSAGWADWPSSPQYDLLGPVPCLGDELYRPLPQLCTTVATNATPAATQCLAFCESLFQGMSRCMGIQVDAYGTCCLLDRDWTWAEAGVASDLLGGAPLDGALFQRWGTHIVRAQDDPRYLADVQVPTACYRRHVDCSSAPNCTDLNRYPCEWGKVANTCDFCRPRYWRPDEPRGVAGNSLCTSDPAAEPPTLRIAFSTSTLWSENYDQWEGTQAAYVGIAFALKRAWATQARALPVPVAERQNFTIEFVGFSENWTKIKSLSANGTDEASTGSVMPGLNAMIGATDSDLQRGLQLRQTSPPGRQVHALLGNAANQDSEKELAAAGDTYHTPIIGFKWTQPEFVGYKYYVRSNRVPLEAGTVIGNVFKLLGLTRIFVFEQIVAARVASQIQVAYPLANVVADGPDAFARGPCSGGDLIALEQVFDAWVRLRLRDARIIAHEHGGDLFENVIPLATDILGPKVLYIMAGVADCFLSDFFTSLASHQIDVRSLDNLYRVADWQGPRCAICDNTVQSVDLTLRLNKTFTAAILYNESTGAAARQAAHCPHLPDLASFLACDYCRTEYGFFASPPCWDLLRRFEDGYARAMCVKEDPSSATQAVQSLLNYVALAGDEAPSDNSTADGLRATARLRAAGMPSSYLELYEPGGRLWDLGLQAADQPLSWTDAWSNARIASAAGLQIKSNTPAPSILDAILTLLVGYNDFVKYGGDADERSRAWTPSAKHPNSYGLLRFLLGVKFAGYQGTVEYTLSGTRNVPYIVSQLLRSRPAGCFCSVRARNATAGGADQEFQVRYVTPTWNFASGPLLPNVSGPLVLDDTNLYACGPFAPQALAGRIVLVARGNCQFATKAMYAQAAGALAVVLWNRNSPFPLLMNAMDAKLVTPGVSIGDTDGRRLAQALRSGLQVHLDILGTTMCFDPTYFITGGFEHWQRTMTFDPKTQSLVMTPGNLTFADGTTAPPLQAPTPCAVGEAYNLSLRECRACSPGTYLRSADAGVCLPCPAGAFSSANGSTACELCSLGQYSAAASGACQACDIGTVSPVLGAPACAPCPPGQYWAASSCSACAPGHFQDDKAMTACKVCPPGYFVADAQKSACSQCWMGSYQGSAGSTACNPCNDSTYQPHSSSTDCLPCESVLPGSRAPGLGTWKPSECQCPQGRYFSRPERDGSAECAPCPRGLTCPGGLDSDRQCCEQPIQNARFHVGKPEFPGGPFPFAIYCADVDKCPAGRALGECPPNATGRACDTCERGFMYSQRQGACVSCGGALAFWPLFVTLLALLAMLVVMFLYARQEMSVQSMTLVTIALTFSLCANVLQVLGAFRLLQLTWPEPLRTLYTALKVCTFDVDLLNPACVFKTNSPDLTYTGALLAHPIFAAVLTLMFFILPLLPRPFRRNRVRAAQLVNAQGVVVLSLYISVCMVSVKPWQCELNPDGTFSVVSFRMVQCWTTGLHGRMLASSACGVFVYGISFIALIAWATYVYPIRITQPGGIDFHCYFRFLFDRFKPSCYSYGLLYCVRNLLLAVIPVVLVNETSAQVLVTGAVVMGSALIQCWAQPWRTALPNFIDAFSSLALMLILLGGSLLVGVLDDVGKAIVQGFFVATLGAVLLVYVSTTLCNAFLVLRPPKRYGIFLSHHKVGAAVLARWFKLHLAHLTTDEIFYDSDNLIQLDQLFDVCSRQTKNLVVLLTRETLRRIWCAGELVSALEHKVPVHLVACNDYEPPGPGFVDKVAAGWTAIQTLEVGRLGVQLEQIKEAYKQLSSMPTLVLDRTTSLDEQRHVVNELFCQCIGLTKTPRALLSKIGLAHGMSSGSHGLAPSTAAPVMLYGEAKDAEDRMVGAVVVILLQMQLGISVFFAEDVTSIGEDGLKSVKYVILLLTRAVLGSPRAGWLVGTAFRRRSVDVLPLNFDASFTFPAGEWYDTLTAGEIYPADDVHLRGISLERVRRSYMKLFSVMSLRFTPHGSENLQRTEVAEMAPRFSRVLQERRSCELKEMGSIILEEGIETVGHVSTTLTAEPSRDLGASEGEDLSFAGGEEVWN